MLHELFCDVCCVCVFCWLWLNVLVSFVCGVFCDVALFVCLCACVCLCVCLFYVRLCVLCLTHCVMLYGVFCVCCVVFEFCFM